MNIEEQLKNIRMADGKTLYQQQLKRARATAILLASATIISLIFLVYAFVQKEHAEKLEIELLATKQALETCQSSK
jgi:hypothetical protein